MWISISSRILGEIDRAGDTAIATRMMCVLHFFPFVPDGSFVRFDAPEAAEETWTPIPLVGRSVAAAYLSHWGPILGLLGLVIGLLAVASGEVVGGLLVSVVFVALAVASLRLVRRLSRLDTDAFEQRRVYGAWIGPSVDPALCGAALTPWVDRLRSFVASGAQGSGARGYRGTPDSSASWAEAALSSGDPALLGATLTLVRADLLCATDESERATLTTLHAELWAQILPRLAEVKAVAGLAEISQVAPLPGRPVLPRKSSLTPLRAALVGVAAVTVMAGAWAAYDYTHPTLYALDLTPARELHFLLDGEPISAAAPTHPRVRSDRVSTGPHELMAINVQGDVVDQRVIEVETGAPTIVYAPAAREGNCLFLFEVIYSRFGTSDPDAGMLVPGGIVWQLPERLDYVLREPPEEIKVGQYEWQDTHMWALSEEACPAMNVKAP